MDSSTRIRICSCMRLSCSCICNNFRSRSSSESPKFKTNNNELIIRMQLFQTRNHNANCQKWSFCFNKKTSVFNRVRERFYIHAIFDREKFLVILRIRNCLSLNMQVELKCWNIFKIFFEIDQN